jgi:hypothetical protein
MRVYDPVPNAMLSGSKGHIITFGAPLRRVSTLMNSNSKQIRMFVVMLSLLVFLLTLNAKLSLYEQPTPVNTANSSKLWLNGQKMEQPAPILVLAVLSVAYVVSRLRFPRSPWQRVQIEAPVPSRLISFRARRFLRPPPASQSLFIA